MGSKRNLVSHNGGANWLKYINGVLCTEELLIEPLSLCVLWIIIDCRVCKDITKLEDFFLFETWWWQDDKGACNRKTIEELVKIAELFFFTFDNIKVFH